MMLSGGGRPGAPPAPDTDREAAITLLYRAQWAGMVRLSLLMLGDRPSAEDAVQEAFAAMYRRWDKIKDGTRVEAYLRSAVLNTSRSVLRRRKLALLHRGQPEPAVWSAESAAMIGEDRREVLAALATLPARRREVLVMRFYLHLSDADIAQTLGITEVSVRSTASRALKSLGHKLKEDR
ncbi:SigE family RNA polymerase sigma factor [Streptomyces sp. SID13031]|uniref:SigE family RNA polymerase sigma factor n=1 Tax=Streptomyces sp. SID13031 TaxID=2706046 RepID=UPI001EF22F6F|nr:SigE family RNA polymerase sigma factor [Streptomyces sp. SID13031]